MDLGHVIEMGITALAGSAPVILYIMANKRQARADTERRHKENQDILGDLLTERRYHPSHRHMEKAGTLTVDGIDYPPPVNSEQGK